MSKEVSIFSALIHEANITLVSKVSKADNIQQYVFILGKNGQSHQPTDD